MIPTTMSGTTKTERGLMPLDHLTQSAPRTGRRRNDMTTKKRCAQPETRRMAIDRTFARVLELRHKLSVEQISSKRGPLIQDIDHENQILKVLRGDKV